MSSGEYSAEFLVGRVMSAVECGVIHYQHLTTDAIRDFVTMYFKSQTQITPVTIMNLLSHLDALNEAAQDTEAETRFSRK